MSFFLFDISECSDEEEDDEDEGATTFSIALSDLS